MTALHGALVARIARTGPISVADYMTECLLHPTHGYYTTRDPLGAAGDFTTAPEISQMFGEMIGLWLAQVWMDQGAPEEFALVELGPGRGTLMADALRATARVPGFHAGVRLHLVEASPALRARQEAALQGHEVTFHDHPASLPDLPTYLIANEFFDALPIRQFQRAKTGWHERMIGVVDGQLAWGLAPEAPMEALADRVADTQEGQIAEWNASAQALAADFGNRIEALGGAALILDYGDEGQHRRHVAGGAGPCPCRCAGQPRRDRPDRACGIRAAGLGQPRAGLTPHAAGGVPGAARHHRAGRGAGGEAARRGA